MANNRTREYANPFKIPLNEVWEDADALELILPERVIKHPSFDDLIILDAQVGLSKIFLRRLDTSDLFFSHWNVNTGIREAAVNLAGLEAQKQLYIAIAWNKQEIAVLAGERPDDPNMRKSSGVQREGKVLLGKDGQLRTVGDNVFGFSERQGGEEIAGSNAEQIWDLAVLRVNALIEGFSLTDNFLFKVTLAQQCLVMLVTGFEVYAKERFGEIERFNIKRASTVALLRKFDRKNNYHDERDRFIAKGGTILESILEVPDGRGIINFQNWNSCKRAYNVGYGIVFGKLPVKGAVLQRLPEYFRYRHQIIHSKQLMFCLNSDKLHEEEPIYIYKDNIEEGEPQFIEKSRDDFQELIRALHEETKKNS